MTLQRRLTLYLIGLIIGGCAAYAFYGKRLTDGAWLPEAKLQQRLKHTLIGATPAAAEAMVQRSIALDAVREAMDSASFDLGSSIRSEDSIVYVVDVNVAGHKGRLLVGTLRDFDKDSVATMLEWKDR